jgi:ethanolamine permease
MTGRKLKRVVRYASIDGEYLQRRQLKKGANWILLWGLGVGAVISGEFSGWNVGLTSGGFGGLAIATILMAAMYLCLVFSIAELSAALPYAGGFYSFTRNAYGPFMGYIAGVVEAIEYVLTPAVIVYFIGLYLNTILPVVPQPFWWIAFYALFIYINTLGVKTTLKVGLYTTVVAIAVLIIFCLGLLLTAKFNPAWWATTTVPVGAGMFKALPYAIWFYLAIEQIPLAAEEAENVVTDVPKSLTTGMYTLLGASFLILIFNSGIPLELTSSTGELVQGAAAVGISGAPLAEGFKLIFGAGFIADFFIFLCLSGVIASFHCIIYAYGRILFALSRAGYIPSWISVTNSKGSPARALILGGVIGLACTLIISFVAKDANLGPALLNMAVCGAVISYIIVLSSYIQLKLNRPNLPRPYQSPLGLPGAFVGIILAVLALLACFADPAYQLSVGLVILFIILAIAYFWFFRRQALIAEAPEEQIALSQEDDE